MKDEEAWYVPWVIRPEQLQRLQQMQQQQQQQVNRSVERRGSLGGHDAVVRKCGQRPPKPLANQRVAHQRTRSCDGGNLPCSNEDDRIPPPCRHQSTQHKDQEFGTLPEDDTSHAHQAGRPSSSSTASSERVKGIRRQVAAGSLAVSLPAINFLSDAEIDELEALQRQTGSGGNGALCPADSANDLDIHLLKSAKRPEQQQQQQRKATKLRRRKACYRHKKDGRSKSLTHIDTLDAGMLVSREEADCRSEPDTCLLVASSAGSQDRLVVPPSSGTLSTAAATSASGCQSMSASSGSSASGQSLPFSAAPPAPIIPQGSVDSAVRRRRLSNLYKITSSEYFSVSFECLEDPGLEEFVAASKGTSLREALAAVCERRGVDLSNVNVYLDSSKTPLSLITTETFWLGGKHLRIKGKDGVKSPVRTAPRPLLQQQSSRKSSGSNRSGKTSRALSGATSTEDAPSSTSGLDYSGGPGSGSMGGHAMAGQCSSSASSTGTMTGGIASATVGSSAPTASALAGNNSHDGSLKGKSTKTSTRWSGLFSSNYKDTKMDHLVEQLNEYSRHGIPRLPHLLTFEADEDTEEALYSLEEDWKHIVVDWTLLTEKQRQQQNAIWELVQTEVAYIRTLKVITDLFMACLCNLQAAQILNEIDTERLFSNVPEIYVANRQFWAEHVVPMLKAARSASAPLDPTVLRPAFLRFDELFHPYTKYCLDQTQCQQYCKEKDHDNELFKAYLAWCETQRDCNRLRLMDILVKPMQRLTKYSLLLKAIHKKTEDEVHKPALIEMIHGVESFVGHVNSALRQRHEQERLREILSRIESYEAIEAKDEEVEKMVRSHCDLDLTRPMHLCSEHQRRHLLIEGDLKLRDQASSKMDVHCFLFTDVLLICKLVTRKAEKVKVIRPPCMVDRLVVMELARDPAALGVVYLNELGTASAAFSLHAPEAKQSKVWLDQIRKAQELYREAKASAAADALAAPQADACHLFYHPHHHHHQQSSMCDDDDDLDFPHSALLVASRSPRGSSRASRGSSLIHSHRSDPTPLPATWSSSDTTAQCDDDRLGSVDMNEAAVAGGAPSARSIGHAESMEIKRASSASSEDGSSTGLAPSAACGPSLHAATGAAVKQPIPSPRYERRSFLGRTLHHQSISPVPSPTPNTLSVQVPHVAASSNSQGQSLPNLLSIAVPIIPAVPPHLASSTGSSLSVCRAHSLSASSLASKGACQRGVSYPPPSPRGIVRSQPVPQSRNPPLVKTRRLASTSGVGLLEFSPLCGCDTNNRSIDIPPTHSKATSESSPPSGDNAQKCSIGIDEITASEQVEPADLEEEDDDDEVRRQQLLNAALAKRLSRNERLDNRRYHTAGAIEDIKKQDVRNSSSIHKRLSWNYGSQSNQSAASGPTGSNLSNSRLHRSGLTGSATNSDSMLSFSSSGVSSTGSLHLSTASEVEDALDVLETNNEGISRVHVSSTYICNPDPPPIEATNVQVRLYQSDKSNSVFQSPLTTRPLPPPPPARSQPVPSSLRLDVSELCDGISSVQITVSGADSSPSSNGPSNGQTVNGKPSRADLLRMKDLILSDTSMEASEV